MALKSHRTHDFHGNKDESDISFILYSIELFYSFTFVERKYLKSVGFLKLF